ncbi:flavin-containing monooxygenase [Trinickia caryophylli]|uniref:flavin-containing monooxygenase n=1 Tax=Trinickia caryophylli TaxID=28094 RepID=UPI000C88942E|nr:NAD(P)/FAD-dependent oxidoreductase [Trinickia caryophylli]PMS10716.1 4-hydroxyacetophenone monooxygenase [Trinickia caryophylli]
MTSAPPRTTPRIAIIGSGFAGIGMAIRLKQMGLTSFTIYEAASDIGGTWRDNRYPGAACDIPSHLYSFSFEPNPHWSRTFAPQQEILAYLERCAQKHGLASFVRLATRVSAVRFDDALRVWRLELQCGDAREPAEAQADIVIAANGPLSRPSLPAIAGIDRFAGKLFHSAAWDHDYVFEGKRVAVIGTGASAVQFVPRIAPQVSQLFVFQRTPPWIMPRRDREIEARAQRLFQRFPLAQRAARWALYWQHEARALAFVLAPGLMKRPMAFARAYLSRRVPDAALRAKLTPDYRLGCKRVLLSSDYYPALCQPNVELVTTRIREIVDEGVMTDDGRLHRVDAIVCGTGFQAGDAGAPFTVIGEQGADLDARWQRDGAQAYLGTAISGFPNFFMMLGPNTGLGHNSMIYMIESHIAYIAECLRTLARRGARTMTVTPAAQHAFNGRVQRASARSVWLTGCRSWYLSKSGRNTQLWPGFTFCFRWLTRRVRTRDYRFEN